MPHTKRHVRMDAYLRTVRAFRETDTLTKFAEDEAEWMRQRTDVEKAQILREGGVGLLVDARMSGELGELVEYGNSRQGRVFMLDQERCESELYRLNWKDAHEWMDRWEAQHKHDAAYQEFGGISDVPWRFRDLDRLCGSTSTPPQPIARVIRAPADFPWRAPANRLRVFLGGASDWQTGFVEKLQHLKVDFYNPRREVYPLPGETEEEEEQQIIWELRAQETCEMLLYYFHPDTQAPVTLLELGLAIGGFLNFRTAPPVGMQPPVVVVLCPPEFHRHLNVRLTCERYYNVTLVHSMQEMAEAVEREAEHHWDR